MQEKPGKRKKAHLAAVVIVAAGAGAAWLLLGNLDDRTIEDGVVKPSLTVEASAEPSAAMSRLSQTPDGRFALFAGSERTAGGRLGRPH